MDLEPASAWSGIGWGFSVLARAWQGDLDRCRTMFEEQRALFPRVDELGPIGSNFMLVIAVEAAAVAGLRDELAGWYPVLAGRLSVLPLAGFDFVLLERLAGMAAAAAEQWDVAEGHFEAALAWPEPPTLEQPRIEHWYAEMLLDRGLPADRPRAKELLESALDRFTTMGMTLYAARAEARLM